MSKESPMPEIVTIPDKDGRPLLWFKPETGHLPSPPAGIVVGPDGRPWFA